MINYYKLAFKKYAEFSGRSNRPEYWYFFLGNIIAAIAIGILSGILGDDSGILNSLYSLAVLVPGLAISFRRLHDIGKSGWWLLIALIPLAGAIWLIVLLAQKGNPEANKYGPAPQASAPAPHAQVSQ